MRLPFVICILITLWTPWVKGQGGLNRGPIYHSYPNPYCQRNLIPHYPVREDWLYGTWKVMYQYQQSEKYDTECKKMEIRKPFSGLLSARLETPIRQIVTTEKHIDSDKKEVNEIIAYHEGPAIEGRFILDKTDGLFTRSTFSATHASALVFLGFTSVDRGTPPRTDPYDTALYAVCSHLGTLKDFGASFISEAGILSKSGNVSDVFLDHYLKLLQDDEIIEPAELKPVDHTACPEPKKSILSNAVLQALLLKLKKDNQNIKSMNETSTDSTTTSSPIESTTMPANESIGDATTSTTTPESTNDTTTTPSPLKR